MSDCRILGLMSGSSLDGLDIALCRFTLEDGKVKKWKILQAETLPYSNEWTQRLRNADAHKGSDLIKLDFQFGALLGELCNLFMDTHHIGPNDVDAVASHGHTLYHDPGKGYTFQLGHGAAVAAKTGLPTISDFRSTDVALGGQGAPLAPLVDQLFYPEFRLFLNIGGIANISAILPESIVAFDVTGANQVLNALAELEGQAYDRNGHLAASAKEYDKELFNALSKLSYFALPYPKSLSNQWVQENMVAPALATSAAVSEKLKAVCHHIGYEVSRAIVEIETQSGEKFNGQKLFITGGGAFNKYLVDAIRQYTMQTSGVDVFVPSKTIVKFKEALLMALMGAFRLNGMPNCLASVTGAFKNAVGGSVYLP